MEIIKSSLIYRGLAAAWIFLRDAWKESLSCKVLAAVSRFFGNLFGGSAIITGIAREGRLQASWQRSWLYRLVDGVCNLGPMAVHWLWTKLETLLQGSFFLRVLVYLGEKLYIVLGLFFAFLLACPQTFWSNSYSLLGALACAILFAMGSAASGRRIRTGDLSIYLLVFGLFLVLATGLSVAPGLSLRFLVFYATAYILMFLVVSSLTTKEELFSFLTLIMLGFSVAVLYGCYQSIEGVEVVLSQVDLETNEGMPGRIYSFFENANAYAQVLIIMTPFYAALLLQTKKLRHKVFWGVMMLAALYALFMTYSRTGYISLAVGIFVFAMIVNWRVLPLCIALGLLALPMLPDTIYRRIMSIFNLADSSTSYRLNIMKTVLQPALERWKCGIGLGSDAVRQIVSNYTLYNEGAVPVHSHNVYLQIFAETGIFGILSFLASMIHLAKEAFRMGYHKLCESSLKFFIISGAAGMAGCLVFGLAEYIWFYPRLMVLFWMVYAMIAAGVRIAKEEAAVKGE